MNEKFSIGDRVCQSALFLRSICPNAAKGWPTTKDLGRGNVTGIVLDIPGCTLVEVDFDNHGKRTFNTLNLISADPDSIYKDAMRAEHHTRKTS